MRHWVLILLGLGMAVSPVVGQQPTTPSLDANQNRLDAILQRWEREMRAVQTIAAQCSRITVDKTFQKTEVFEGLAKYMKPSFAMLDMRDHNNPQVFEKYICTGNFLYVYEPHNKMVKVYELPTPRPGQVADDNFLSFLFGMRADEAKRRYELQLWKEDQWWIYILIKPRFPADKADFQVARLTLSAQTFMPRELWFTQPNGNEVKWDIPVVQNGAPLNRAEFTDPAVPQGWQVVRVPRANDPRGDGPPRVVRPSP